MSDRAKFLDNIGDLGTEVVKKGLPKLGGILIRAASAAVSKTPIGGVLDEFGVLDELGKALRKDPDPEVLIDEIRGMTPQQLTSYTALRTAEADVRKEEIARAKAAEGELTKRHAADMMNHSWLPANIRPLALAVLVIAVLVDVFSTKILLAVGKESEDSQVLLELCSVAVQFYFGSKALQYSVGFIADKWGGKIGK